MWSSSGTMRTIGPEGRQTWLRDSCSWMSFDFRHDPTILPVILLDHEGELTFSDDVVVIFMPSAKGGIFGPRESGERMEVQAVNGQTKKICQPSHRQGSRCMAEIGRKRHPRMNEVDENF